MTLKGQAKTDYQREYMRDYMRKHRAVKTQANVKTQAETPVKTHRSSVALAPDGYPIQYTNQMMVGYVPPEQ